MRKFSAKACAVAFFCAAAAPGHAIDVVVTQYKADPSGAPFAVALEKGFFKQAGVDITGVISGAGGGTSVRNVIASELGYGEVSPAPVIAAILEGQDLRIVNLGSRTLDHFVVVMPNSPIKTPQDLKGRKLGISNPKSLGEMASVLVMEKLGFKPEDGPRVALGSLTGALTALENGVVDAVSIPSILFYTRGGESKYRILLRSKELPSLPPGLGIATGDVIKKNPERIRAIIAARRQAVRFIYERPAEAKQILAKLYQPLPASEVSRLVDNLIEAQYWSEGKVEMALLETTTRAMRYVGMLDRPVDLNKMVERSLLPKDLQ